MIRRLSYHFLVGVFLLQILLSGVVNKISQILIGLPIIKRLKRKFRAGNLLSRLARLVMETKWIKTVFGANLAAALLVGSLGVPIDDYHQFLDPNPPAIQEVVAFDPDSIVLTTEEFEYTVPVVEFIGISTRFSSTHAGWDFRAPLGSGVRPILKGRVVKIVHARFGYGRHVYVDHGNGLMSMYAHLGKIRVEEGEEVTSDTILGEIGLTGWTTGPHLHFEVYEDGVAINPGLLFDL